MTEHDSYSSSPTLVYVNVYMPASNDSTLNSVISPVCLKITSPEASLISITAPVKLIHSTLTFKTSPQVMLSNETISTLDENLETSNNTQSEL